MPAQAPPIVPQPARWLHVWGEDAVTRCRTLLRYFETVRHLQPGQIACRALRLAERAAPFGRDWSAEAAPPRRVGARLLPGLGAGSLAVDEADHRVARQLLERRFSFLGEERSFPSRVDWSGERVSRLWNYHLHYFDYARSLALTARATGEAVYAQTLVALLEEWVAANPPPRGDGWHPFTVSVRLANWLYALELVESLGAAVVPQRVVDSLAQQARYLARHLEFDVLGNHLLKNARALVLAGLFFTGPEAADWLVRGTGLFWRELAAQVLGDGGHYERSPMYHLLVLRDALEVAAALLANGQRLPPSWDDHLAAMLRFAQRLRHPDGQIPLFNDSVLGEAPPPLELLAAGAALLGMAEFKEAPDLTGWWRLVLPGGAVAAFERLAPRERSVAPVALTQSGYFVLPLSADDVLLADCGPFGPPFLLAHAHADALSYELAVAGRRLIVDSGVAEYQAGPARAYARSTAAHNTVSYDGQDQGEMWASFRVARRPAVMLRRWHASEDGVLLDGEHDGYRLSGVIHRRRLLAVRRRAWLVVDELRGRGSGVIRSFVHLHPEAQVARVAGGWLIRRGPAVARCLSFGPARWSAESPERGWYAERFGQPCANPVLVLEATACPPVRFGYVLVPGVQGDVEVRVDGRELREVRLGLGDAEFRIALDAEGCSIVQCR